MKLNIRFLSLGLLITGLVLFYLGIYHTTDIFLYFKQNLNSRINLYFIIIYCSLLFGSFLGILTSLSTNRSSNSLVLKSVKKLEYIIIFKLFILVVVLLINIRTLGNVPIWDHLVYGNLLNDLRVELGGGLFGICHLLTLTLSILVSFSYLFVHNHKKLFRLIRGISTLVIFFGFTYTGARQGLFIFACAFLALFSLKHNSSLKTIKVGLSTLLFLLLPIFVLLGMKRLNFDFTNLGFDEITYPIRFYLALPMINWNYALQVGPVEATNHDYIRWTLFEYAPYFFTEGEAKSVFPRKILSSPSGLYASSSIYFGFFGVACMGFVHGFIFFLLEGWFYKCCRSAIFVYPLAIWPIISMVSQGGYLNFSTFLLPTIILLFWAKILFVYKNNDTGVDSQKRIQQ